VDGFEASFFAITGLGSAFPLVVFSLIKNLHLNVYDLLYPSAKLWSVTQVSPVQHSMMLDLQCAQASWPCTTIVCNGAAQRGQRWIWALAGCAWLSTISFTNWKSAGEASLVRTKPISQILRSWIYFSIRRLRSHKAPIRQG
jgi:hypothetical protein